MENRINLVEMLKDCPKGMELDCTMFDGLEFDLIDVKSCLPIRCRAKRPDGEYNLYVFNKHGHWNDCFNSKCVIFPKGKTTWEGFHRPFVDGDVVFSGFDLISIYKEQIGGNFGILHSHVSLRNSSVLEIDKDCWTLENIRFATEEEKLKLFNAIQDNGYKWNEETKTLKKLIRPRFKVGDRIKRKGHDDSGRIEKIDDNAYHVDYSFDDGVVYVGLKSQDDYELVPNKFDINTLKPFESRVLVRDKNTDEWRGHFFSHYDCNSDRPYVCIGVEGINEYKRCIPYKDNEHLLGTTNNCDEFYRVWEE